MTDLLSGLNILDVITAGATFALVLAVWLGGLLLWRVRRSSKEQKVQERIGLAETGRRTDRVLRLWHDGAEVQTTVPGGPRRRSLKHWANRLRDEAGWTIPVHTAALGLVGVTLLAFVLVYMPTRQLLAGLCGSVAVVVIFWAYLKRRISRRESVFEMQFVDALELAARSLRAGHPLMGAFRVIAEEITPPVGTVFAEVCQQQALGVSLEAAVEQAGVDSHSPDMRLFATSVVIQLRSGGNLADMMERLAYVVRERIRLSRRVRVLTAQTQFSKRILIALPFAMLALLNVLSPRYIQTLHATNTGKILLAIAATGVLLGMWTMNRMAKIRM